MLLTQTTPISHALPMHQAHRTQLTLLLQNVSIYLHHMHNTILILERINNNMDPFFNSQTSLVLLCWIYQIYWMWLLISSLTSLIHPHSAFLLFSFYAAENSISSPAKKKNSSHLWLFSFSSGFLQCLPPYAPKPTNFLIAQPIQTIIRRHHTTSPQSIKSSRHAKRSHQRLHTSLIVLPMQA
jgi:hypothetical protein